jgi:glycosyltransferase involved in cell wall biosynthesis
MHEMWPEAPIYTSVYLPEAMPRAYRSWDIRTSFMQRLPGLRSHFQKYLPLFPMAFEQFDFGGYDLVLDNSSAFSYGVITRPETLHVSYCLTPARFLWLYHDYVRREGLGTGARLALAPFLTQLRVWDRLAAERVDEFIGISQAIRARIRKVYRRDAAVIYPPVDCDRFEVGRGGGDYFLIVGRLVPYKRVDLAIEACKRLGVKLKIAGGSGKHGGRDRARLEAIAAGAPNVEFLGWVSNEQLRELYARCRAFLFVGEEDFGIVPLEANAAGRPVIAYAGGGALETVVDGETGTFFHEPTADALAEVLAKFDERQYDPAHLRAHAERFGIPVFKERLAAFVREKLGDRTAATTGHARDTRALA